MTNHLSQIDHIVVLMLENRSFDHMLGYLRLEGTLPKIDGLTGHEVNDYPDGTPHGPERLTETVFSPDPHHDWDNIKIQLDENNGGFVKDFANYDPIPEKPERVIHYHNASDVPAFDFLAKEFCVCDRWFSSIPAATQPNRMYALAGHSNGQKDNLPLSKLLMGGWEVRPIFEFLPAGVSWRYYSHDIASLRFIKGYQAFVPEIDKINSFYERAKQGTLANVSWIDPNFDILSLYPGPPNDDHPPHDISNGQNLVKKVYNALINSPNWSKTLFVIVYDEHGGFYDHVSPGLWTPADSVPEFRKYGVRVPALVISPWVGKNVYGSGQNVAFDHTSILRTILLRFCTPTGGLAPAMTARVDAATDLGAMLTEPQARTDCKPMPDLPFTISFNDRFVLTEDATEPRLRRMLKRPPTELQQSLAALAQKAIAQGVPPEKL